MNIRDGGKIHRNGVSKESLVLSGRLREQPKPARVNDFAEIIALEVGETNLLRSKNIERDYSLRQVYLKLEGNNPSGTQKDRIGFAQVLDALEKGVDILCLATCGNYGASVALAANLAGLACNIFIPRAYHTERIGEMEKLGAKIFRRGDTYEDAVSESSRAAAENGWYDANPGSLNTQLQLKAYSIIANEICAQLGSAPAYCAVPVSNGTLLAGIYEGFVALYESGVTQRVPKMIAGSSVHKNPIVSSFRTNSRQCIDLDPAKIKESVVNEPLINWHSIDGQEALDAIFNSGGLATNSSDRAMKQMSAYLLERESMRILPASTAGLIGLLEQHQSVPMESDQYVAILTARN